MRALAILSHQRAAVWVTYLEDPGWLGDPPSPRSHSAHCDYTYILGGQELHAIGHLVAEAHKIRVAKHWGLVDQSHPARPLRS